MATTRPNHVVEETDEISRAIDAASPYYPGKTRTDILLHLIQLGAKVITEGDAQHRNAVRDRAGRQPGVYATRYLEDLRTEWPE